MLLDDGEERGLLALVRHDLVPDDHVEEVLVLRGLPAVEPKSLTVEFLRLRFFAGEA